MQLKNEILPEERRPKVRNILASGGLIRAIEAHNGISGLIGDRASISLGNTRREFNALWISSLTDSVAKGCPDEEIVTVDSRLDTVHQVLNVTVKPLIYDGDTGGFYEQMNYLIKRLERAGVSAIVLEDKKYPKSNSLLETAKHSLEDIETFCKKIKYSKDSQKTEEFMVIARIESLICGESLEKALERASAYLEAGADGIMIHSKKTTPHEVLEFAEKYNQLNLGQRKPLMAVPTTYNATDEATLIKAGFNIILYANQLLRASYKAMTQTCESILRTGNASEADTSFCASLRDILEPVGSCRTYLAEYDSKENGKC